MVEFREYQTEIISQAVSTLKSLKIVYLAMEVRTGKTLTSLGICEHMNAKNVLFITKKKAISSIEKDNKLLNPSYSLSVINYESLHKLEPKQYDIVIVDEGHSLGAFPKASKRTKDIKALIKETPLIILSGTPTPESWSQIYHQFWISKNTPFEESTFYKWSKNYVDVKQKFVAHGNKANDYSDAKVEKVKEILTPYMISYTQKEAGFTTNVEEEILYVDMLPTTYDLIDKVERDLVFVGKNGGVILADTGVKLMQKVHQLYSGTVKLEDGSAVIVDKSKAEFIKERFSNKKIAIFYKFKMELEALQQVYGDTLTNDLEEFNTTPKSIALQIVSGREGISLSKAEYIIFYNIDFSATSYFQAKDRLTTKERLFNKVYWIFARGGLESKIYKSVLQKKNFTTKHYERAKVSIEAN